jgi:hypothetical protein
MAYSGRVDDTNFIALLDYGSSFAQFTYRVRFPTMFEQRRGFTYEEVFGFGSGQWNFIEEGREDDAMSVLCDVVVALAMVAREVVRAR